MEQMIKIFSRLGERVEKFGTESTTNTVIERATKENEWFTREDILLAVKAIREEFLAEEKLLAWASRYPKCPSRCVAIIMAGNIPLVGFYDMLCTLLCGHRALIKPSSKDRVLMQYITEELLSIEPALKIEPFKEGDIADMVIATGGNQAARHFSHRYGSLPTIIRGSRHSLAVLDERTTEEQLSALSEDIFSYSGLGCRNVSLVLYPEGHRPTLKMPTKANPMHYGNYLHARAMRTLLGEQFQDRDGYIEVEQWAFSDNISQLNLHPYRSKEQVAEWLEQHDNEIQCIVSDTLHHPRGVAFGRAQYPTLEDVADGVDVMEFLTRQ